jgi:hypothetical protein
MPTKQTNNQVRIVYSGDPERTTVVQNNPGKIFATIGPFDSHEDKVELQKALTMLLRLWNHEHRKIANEVYDNIMDYGNVEGMSGLTAHFDPVPLCSIPDDAPKPWYVAGTSFNSCRNVIESDYLGRMTSSPIAVWKLPNGSISYISHFEQLLGLKHGVGTIFILQSGLSGTRLDDIRSQARRSLAQSRHLETSRSKQE